MLIRAKSIRDLGQISREFFQVTMEFEPMQPPSGEDGQTKFAETEEHLHAVYGELHRLAHSFLSRERPAHSLQMAKGPGI